MIVSLLLENYLWDNTFRNFTLGGWVFKPHLQLNSECISHTYENHFFVVLLNHIVLSSTQFLAQVSHSTGTFPSRAEVLKCQGPWENHGNDWNYLRTGGVGARSILGGSHHHQKGGGGVWKRQSFLTEYKKGGDAIESWLPWGGGGNHSNTTEP